MKLSRLDVTGVRNLSRVSLGSLGRVNVFHGDNGAGKTSLLEAIHILGLARSFRSTQLQPVICYDMDACTVYGEVERLDGSGFSLGVERSRRGRFRARLDGVSERRLVRLADEFPVQLINASANALLESGPKQRRQFVDWGVFHVEHQFYGIWQRLQRAVKQRNSLLRARRSSRGIESELDQWDRELALAGEAIDQARGRYIRDFSPAFQRHLSALLKLSELRIDYRRGWSEEMALIQALRESRERDCRRGVTHVGPHRADLRVTVNGHEAGQVLSRGQQKMVVCAMRLAQCELLVSLSPSKRCVMLVDDLPAEMDEEHQAKLCQSLYSLGVQLFMTCVDPSSLSNQVWAGVDGECRLFHVEQGEVRESS